MTTLTPTPATKPASRFSGHVFWSEYLPKSIVCIEEGYGKSFFLSDLFAGLTVGVIALPLAMAFAIGAGVEPQRGLYTAIIAGFVIAVLGGSRVSVAGPTGAFMPILAAIVFKHGYSGLAIAALMAGVILILLGVAKLGTLIKYIPYPVTTGFTSGIAVIIFTSQIKNLLGLQLVNEQLEKMDKVPAEFVHQVQAYARSISSINWATAAVGVGGVVVIALLRRLAPRVPGAIVAVVLAAAVVGALHLDSRYGIPTINSAFNGIPQRPPTPELPMQLSWAGILDFFGKARQLVPEATTIALLAAIESLLCCVVADGMIGGRHKSNCELIAQGVGNVASVFFGGIPATGAIARTAANVKAGGRTPLAAIIHAIFVLIVMLLLAPYAGKIPLAVLASVLVVVAWNMSEIDHFRTLLRAPRSDIIVLLTTFGLTVLADLTVAVGVGMVLAALLFMKRMSQVTSFAAIKDDEPHSIDEEFPDLSDPNSIVRRDVPPGAEVYEINGPFFFGVADRLKDTLRQFERPPKVFILRMRHVNAIDATGLHALEEFFLKCKRQGTTLLLAGVHAQPMFAMMNYGLVDRIGETNLFGNIDDALNRARELVGQKTQPKPAEAQPEVAREKAP